MHVFRNNTVERFFPKEYTFSGYDDISVVPEEADSYVWFYQVPVGCSREIAVETIGGYKQKFALVLSRIEARKTFIAMTMEEVFGLPLTEDDYSVRKAIGEYNGFLFEAEKTHSNLKVLDYSEFIRNAPEAELIDWKFFFISQMGINPRLTNPFQVWWQRKLDSISMKRKKCIVLDLDNTLWGGVLGEDGISGIKIGGDYPGKAYSFFQQSLLQLSDTGVILTVCSKNNEADVLAAWENNPFMILKKEHFATYRINWLDKATNIRDIANELNIGLDSLVFVDDNPAERDLVRQMLPMVSIPDFPAQPYDLPVFFKKLVGDFFKVYTTTNEDKKKTEQYKANFARSQAQHAFPDFKSFLESLDMQITIEAANDFNIPRISQMTQKTNQFNLTTRRYTEADVKSFLANEGFIWCMSVADRFGDNGITGAVFVKGSEIDSMLLSCRILGRGIEFAFLKKVLSLLKARGVAEVKAKYLPTLKNGQVADFYDKCGFVLISETEGIKSYVSDLNNADLSIEEYYHINVQ